MKLPIDLVPQSVWFSNLRSILTTAEWQRIKDKTFQLAGYRCEYCGGVGKKHPVECHEVFEYNDETKRQTLIKTVALCPSCHLATHYGLAQAKNLKYAAEKQLKKVNQISNEELQKYISDCFKLWEERSKHYWILDALRLNTFILLSPESKQRIAVLAADMEHRMGDVEKSKWRNLFFKDKTK